MRPMSSRKQTGCTTASQRPCLSSAQNLQVIMGPRQEQLPEPLDRAGDSGFGAVKEAGLTCKGWLQ